jgi:hypothetical protein
VRERGTGTNIEKRQRDNQRHCSGRGWEAGFGRGGDVPIVGGDTTESRAHGFEGPLRGHWIERGFVRHQGLGQWRVFGLGEKHSAEEGPDEGNHVAVVEWEYGVERKFACETEEIESFQFTVSEKPGFI